MNKNIFLYTILIFGLYPVLYSMEPTAQDNLDCFTVATNDDEFFDDKNLNLRFRRVTLENLLNPTNEREKQDRELFINLLSDFEANKSGYGQDFADMLQPLTAQALLEYFIQSQNNKLEKMQDKKIMIHWIIEDATNNNAFVGRASIHTYPDSRPESHKDAFLLAFALTMSTAYRGKGVLSHIASEALRTLAIFKEFEDVQFCFYTYKDNIVSYTIAEKIHAQKIHTWEREISMDKQSVIGTCELFIIPKMI